MSVINDIDLTPITRLEYDIDAILNDHAVAEPITRIELILADIVAGNTTTVEPVTRIETYLAIISGADYPVPEPVTRIETFLAIIAGEDYEEPEAVTRLEGLLAEWVEKGSGIWKTVTGTLIHITDALASHVKELSVAIEPQQSGSGDPSPTNIRPITGWTGATIYKRANSLGIPLDPTDKTVNNCQITYIKSNGTVKEVKFLRNSGTTGGVNEILFRAYAPNTGTYYVKATGFTGLASNYHIYYNVGGVNTDTLDGSFSFNATKGDNITVGVYVSSKKNINIQFGFPILSSAPISEDYVIDQGVDIPISWQTEAGTVYGGTLTVNEDGSVDLQPTYGGIIYTSENINLLSAGNNYLRADTGVSNSLNNWQAPTYCSHYKINGSPIGIVGSNDNRRFWINAQDLNNPTVMANVTNDNLQDYKDFFIAQAENGTPLTIVWQLKRNIPDPIHLQSIEQIYTLAGENNIWGDGNIELTYKAQA